MCGFTKRRAPADGRLRCTTRRTIGDGGSTVGSMCSTQRRLPRGSRAAGVFVWTVRRVLERVRRARRARRAGHSQRRHDVAARLDLIQRTGTTALFCTPTYAPRLAEVAGENHIDLAGTCSAGRSSLPANRAARFRRCASESNKRGMRGSSTMPARRKSAPGATVTRRATACTCWRPNSLPSSSDPATAGAKAKSRNWC